MTIFTYKNLYLAYLDCRKNKRKTANALKFELDCENKLFDLLKDLQDRTYKQGRLIRFVVLEPKPREIFASDFRDRVVHHLFVRELMATAEKQFISDSFACRRGKGTHKAVERLKKFIKIAKSKNVGGVLHYMQIDIKAFFPSIDQNILFAIIKKLIVKAGRSEDWNNEMEFMARKIIYCDITDNYVYKGKERLKNLIPKEKSLLGQPPGRGLPIGNYTSQFFANAYLNVLDQFIKRRLKEKFYVRYVDDLVFVGGSGEKLIETRNKIMLFIRRELNLSLNDKKTKIRPVVFGIDFLGYFIKEDCVYVRRKVVSRFKRRIFSPKTDFTAMPEVLSSYFAHFKKADSFRLRTKLAEHYNYLSRNPYGS